jgi:hypothetical protein
MIYYIYHTILKENVLTIQRIIVYIYHHIARENTIL